MRGRYKFRTLHYIHWWQLSADIDQNDLWSHLIVPKAW